MAKEIDILNINIVQSSARIASTRIVMPPFAANRALKYHNTSKKRSFGLEVDKVVHAVYQSSHKKMAALPPQYFDFQKDCDRLRELRHKDLRRAYEMCQRMENEYAIFSQASHYQNDFYRSYGKLCGRIIREKKSGLYLKLNPEKGIQAIKQYIAVGTATYYTKFTLADVLFFNDKKSEGIELYKIIKEESTDDLMKAKACIQLLLAEKQRLAHQLFKGIEEVQPFIDSCFHTAHRILNNKFDKDFMLLARLYAFKADLSINTVERINRYNQSLACMKNLKEFNYLEWDVLNALRVLSYKQKKMAVA